MCAAVFIVCSLKYYILAYYLDDNFEKTHVNDIFDRFMG